MTSPVVPALDVQRESVASERKILEDAKAIRARNASARLAERMRHHAALAVSVPMPKRRFPVVLADPPWRFKVYSAAGSLRSPDYPTMTVEDIAALDIPAADAAVLFLWATVPMLPHSLSVMAAWGFDYRSHFVWLKDRIGTGYWVRNKHEILLIGARGDIPAPAPGTRAESVIIAPTGRHSEKPAEVHAVIERMYPTLPRIELFARTTRAGWAAWGNQLECKAPASNAESRSPDRLMAEQHNQRGLS